jgi:hypothetical protein
MNIKHIFWLFFLLLLITRCDESERGQYPIDSVPPGEIKLLRVENLHGESIIYYEIPDDDDLLYVKASYKRDNGTETEQKVSAYSRNIKIEGISRSHELDVKLVAVDRSRNESLPVSVKVFPLDSPIHSTLASLILTEDFGGIRVVWNNPTGKEQGMVICVDSPNEAGELINAKNFYINSLKGTGNVRGFDSEERLFIIYIRDYWGNHSDTISSVLTPLFEEELKEGIRRWNPPGIPYSAYSRYHIENMWDGSKESFYLVQTKGLFPYSFTFDLGKKIKLSRVKQIQRQDQVYTGQNIQFFQLWGTNSPYEVSANFEKWIKLGDFEMIKPSGFPLGENSPEDIAVASEGHDFNIDLDAPSVRYIRYIIVATWSGDQNASIAELRFYGSIEE